MSVDDFRDALRRLETNDAAIILQGLYDIEGQLPSLSDNELAKVVSAVNAIFYFDTYEYPQLQPVVERAVATLSTAGERVVPHLLRLLGDSDYKVEFHYALIFGRIGAAAVEPLLQACRSAGDASEKSFVIYALGKIKSPVVKSAIELVLEEIGSSAKEVRDSSARTLGKIMENVSASEVEQSLRSAVFARLIGALRDTHSGVRAKACRSLGKMAKRGYLDGTETKILSQETARLLGRGEGNWDEAFVVRKEAAEVEEIVRTPG